MHNKVQKYVSFLFVICYVLVWLFRFALSYSCDFCSLFSFTLEMQNFLISISCFSSSLALTRILFFVCSLFAVIMNIFPVCLCDLPFNVCFVFFFVFFYFFFCCCLCLLLFRCKLRAINLTFLARLLDLLCV